MQHLATWLNKLVKGLIIILLPAISITVNAQPLSHLTLEQANLLAQQNYPLIKQKDLVKQATDITINNLNKQFLPQPSVSGQATYQSDVTKVDVPFPGFKLEPPNKDQYKILADVSQLIYDGGAVKQQKELQQLNGDVEMQKVEVELYKVREKVNQLYLNILYLDEQRKQVELIKQDFNTGIRTVGAQVENGVAFKSNLNVLKAELLKATQRLIELNALRKGMLETLSLFFNQPIDSNVVLETPGALSSIYQDTISRPEVKLFSYQSQVLGHQTKIIQAKNQPRASLFVQGGYGRPALNLLKNQFEPFYVTGVRLNWLLGGLYTQKNERQLVDITKKNIDIQKQTFLLNTNTQLKQQQSEIEKLQQLFSGDDEIISLRTQVKDAAKAKLENGVITANDYLREVNAEDQARQTRITHQLQLLQAQINYQTISGKQ
ncbi:MAG: TolC family protein [Ginsengibacter sp.]